MKPCRPNLASRTPPTKSFSTCASVERLSELRLAALMLFGREPARIYLQKCWRPAKWPVPSAFGWRRQLAVASVAADHDGAAALAGESGLSANDASDLWLAGEFGTEPVTLDRRLAEAAVGVRP